MKVYFAGSCIANESVASFLCRTISGIDPEFLMHHRVIEQEAFLVLVDGPEIFPKEAIDARFGTPARILHICGQGEVINTPKYTRAVGNVYDDSRTLAIQFIGETITNIETRVDKR